MKKLGNGKGRRVHPAPPPAAAPRDNLAALPTAVLALAAALTAEEQEVLAYLLSGGAGERWRDRPPSRRAHPPELECRCFGCYKSFWARWDASPNRHVIHRIIDAVEESLESRGRDRWGGGRRRRRSGRGGRKGADLEVQVSAEEAAAAAAAEEGTLGVDVKGFPTLGGGHLADDDDYDEDDSSIDYADEAEDGDEEEELSGGSNSNKSSMRRFMSFIGERVLGVWN